MSAGNRPARSLSPDVLKALKVEALVRHLAKVAEGLGARFVLLKGGAIHLLGLVGRDERPMGDLDVLLSPGDAERLQTALIAQGWTTTELPELGTGDHLPRLMHPVWPHVELHYQLEGVRIGNRCPVRFADLEEGGLLAPLVEGEGVVLVPSRGLLAAHAIAHGFIHHKDVAPYYPVRRVFDDLRALGVVEQSDEDFMQGPGRWISEELPREEVLTILRLSRRLARGEDVGDEPMTPEARLLELVKRREGDHDFRSASRLQNLWRLAGKGPDPVRTWLKKAWTVVFINRYQVDVLYGRPKHEWGYAVRQVLRPFDLVLRVVRYSFAWLRLRLRREPPTPVAGS